MAFDERYFNIGQLDSLSYRDSPVHRLDARAKVAVAMLFILAVVSFPKYAVTELAPFFLFPVMALALSDVPVLFIVKKVLFVSPFAIFIGVFNPVLDRETMTIVLGIPVSAGWISFASIMVKFSLTISAALLLIATTSFPGVCLALRRLGAPQLFIQQLLFLYRYLFVLLEEAMRFVRARDLRSFGKRGTDARTTARIIGVLFLRTMERSERVYSAMLSRGFRGDIPSARESRFRPADGLFLAEAAAAILVFRFVSVPHLFGRAVQEVFR